MEDHFDPEHLREVLATELGPCHEFEVDSLKGGHSRTQTIVSRDGDRFVVVFGEQLDAWQRLQDLTDTPIPVPEPVVRIEDDRVPGDRGELFIRRYVPGETVYRTEPDRLASPEVRRAFSRRIVETLGAIHDIDAEQLEAGNPTIRPPCDVVSRLRTTIEDLANSHDDRSYERVRHIGSWLEQRVPEPIELCLVHGDFKLDNVVVGPAQSSSLAVRAVLDWEHSFLGDPRIDLGYFLIHWCDDTLNPVVPAAILPRTTGRNGYPSRRCLLRYYKSLTGRSFEDQRFFFVLALFELACACEIIYRQGAEGQTLDIDRNVLERGLPALIERAFRIVEGEETV